MLSLRAAARHNGIRISPPPSAITRSGTRHIQTATVTDSDIARLSSKPLHPLTLADLCNHGRQPLTTAQLLNSANFTLGILPSRIAHRIQVLRSLPYIVVANPNISKIHSQYVHSLSTLLPYAQGRIETLEDEIKFTEVLADLVQTHSNTIAILAKGFLEARKYITAQEITKFLDRHLRARIGTRLIAEQHIALHLSSQPHMESEQEGDLQHHAGEEGEGTYIGVIDTALKPAAVIRNCEHIVGEICELNYGVRPTVEIVGSLDTTIAHIPMHLEYILTEVLKNSFRATIEAGMEKEPIEITIAPAHVVQEIKQGAFPPKPKRALSKGKHKPPAPQRPPQQQQQPQDSKDDIPPPAAAPISPLAPSTPGVTIRIRDRGGGIRPDDYAQLWQYGFTTFNEDQINEKTGSGGMGVAALDVISGSGGGGGSSSLAGLGYGLPLGRAYAEYFGGGIAIQSLWGWGTDVYVSLKGVGEIR